MKPNEIMDKLQVMQIDYLTHEHPALFTVDDVKACDVEMPGGHCKNMLLANKKRTKFALVILESSKRMNFKAIGNLIGMSGLKFAKESTLERFDTFAGSVSPFIILEDQDSEIQVFMDKELMDYNLINFHPNINTITLGIQTNGFVDFMKEEHHEITLIEYTPPK